MSDNSTAITQPQKKSPSAEFGIELIKYTQQLESLANAFPSVMALAAGSCEKANRELNEYLEKNATEVQAANGEKTYRVAGAAAKKAAKLNRLARNAEQAYILLHRSFLTSLVSQYDSFLGRLIARIYLTKPEILNSSEISFGELVQFKSIEHARDFLIEKEVEAIIRKSHAEHFSWLEKTFGIPFRDNLDIWPQFIEITERRNLFVHCDGVVSTQYLSVCRQHKVTLEADVQIGVQLEITRPYLESSFDCLFEIGVKLAQVIWRKLLPDSLAEADSNLNAIAFDLMQRGNNQLASKVLDFACCVLKKHSSEEMRRYLILNRAQAYKWLGKESEALKVINAEDWSACGEKLKLAVAVIKEEFKLAADFVSSLKGDKIFPEAYKEWPVFKKFRESKEFLEAYKSTYGREFEVEEIITKSP